MRDRVAGLRLGDFNIPKHLAVARVQSEQVRIDGPHVERVAQNGDAAIHAAAARPRLPRRGIRVQPFDLAGGGVERDHIIGRLRQIHRAIHHDRRGFEFLERSRLERPLQLEIPDVARIDLRQRAVALAERRTRVRKPVLRFFFSA